jgi:hypothetical protein
MPWNVRPVYSAGVRGGSVILKGSARMFLIFVLLLAGLDRNYLFPHVLLHVTVAVTEYTGLCNSGKAHGQTFCTWRSRFGEWARGGSCIPHPFTGFLFILPSLSLFPVRTPFNIMSLL